MKEKTLFCVGGPEAGKYFTIKPGQRSLIIATPGPIDLLPAWMHTSEKIPPYAITVEQAVYMVQKVSVTGEGFHFEMEVLGYFGQG